MIDNQLSRRNLSPNQMSYLRGKKYLAEKQKPWRPKKENKVATVATLPKTREKIASETNVSPPTIVRDGQYAQAVDNISGKLDAL